MPEFERMIDLHLTGEDWAKEGLRAFLWDNKIGLLRIVQQQAESE